MHEGHDAENQSPLSNECGKGRIQWNQDTC